MTSLLVSLITFYQQTISPNHSPWGRIHTHAACRYYPSCSEYAKQSILGHGALKGSFLAVSRVCRCHPWALGGADPVLSKTRN